MADVADWRLLTDQKVEPIGGILDPITAMLNQRHEEQVRRAQQERELAFKREQETRLYARQDAEQAINERRLRGKQVVENAGREQTADAAIRAAAGIPGNLPEAQRLASSFTGLDADGNPVHGRPFSQRPNPKPQVPSQEEGPVPSPEEAHQEGIIRAGEDASQFNQQGIQQQVDQAEGEQQRFAGVRQAQEAYPGQRRAFQRERDNPHVSIGGVETTPQDIRHTKSRADAADFKATMAPLMQKLAQAQQIGDPTVIASVQRQIDTANQVTPQVEQGILSPIQAAGQVNAAGSLEAGIEARRQSQMVVNDQQNAAAQKRAETLASGRAEATAAGAASKAGGEDLKLRRMMIPEVKLLQDNYGIKDIGKTIRSTQELQNAVKLGDKNSAEAARAVGKWVKVAQGAGDRTSDQDIKIFFDRIGGIEKWGSLDAALSALASRTLNPDVQKQIIAAANEMAASQRANVDEFLAAGDRQLGATYGRHWQDFRNGLSGMGSQQPALGAPGAAPLKGGGTPPVPGAVLQRNKKTGQTRWKLPDGTSVDAQ
jgi:hypothetical protein